MDRQQDYTVENVDLKWLEQTVRRAGEIALSHFRQVKAERKADSTIVTAADKEIEAFLRDELSQAFPDDGLLGEEMPMHRGSNGRVWAIDPIDGTGFLCIRPPGLGSLSGVDERLAAHSGRVLHATDR